METIKKIALWVKEKLAKEKAAVVGFLVTVAWFINDGIVDNDWTQWKVLVPMVTALIIRVFVTSEGVKPGWRSQK